MPATTGLPALGGLDGVELKLNVAADRIDRACQVFGLDAAAAKPRRIWFGEVLDGRDGPGALPLSARGIVLRVRAKRTGGDVTLKLRGPDGGVGVGAWRDGAGRDPDAKIEGDWAGRRLVSASLDSDLDRAAVEHLDVRAGGLPGLLSAQQRRLARQLMIPVERVALLGPVAAQKWEAEKDGDIEAELWEVDTLRFLEISLLVTHDPEAEMERLRRRARDGGLALGGDQETKTDTVLRHLASGR